MFLNPTPWNTRQRWDEGDLGLGTYRAIQQFELNTMNFRREMSIFK